jgi:hypothetical protein
MLRGARGERTHAVLKMPSSGSADSSDIHLGHDFHERLVAFCHDGRGIALSRLYATISIISAWWRCAFQWPVLNLRVA